jgi:hypothetical protein
VSKDWPTKEKSFARSGVYGWRSVVFLNRRSTVSYAAINNTGSIQITIIGMPITYSTAVPNARLEASGHV